MNCEHIPGMNLILNVKVNLRLCYMMTTRQRSTDECLCSPNRIRFHWWCFPVPPHLSSGPLISTFLFEKILLQPSRLGVLLPTSAMKSTSSQQQSFRVCHLYICWRLLLCSVIFFEEISSVFTVATGCSEIPLYASLYKKRTLSCERIRPWVYLFIFKKIITNNMVHKNLSDPLLPSLCAVPGRLAWTPPCSDFCLGVRRFFYVSTPATSS